jgi:hypothetical protein
MEKLEPNVQWRKGLDVSFLWNQDKSISEGSKANTQTETRTRYRVRTVESRREEGVLVKPFDFDKKVESVVWDVDGLIASETLSFVVAKARAGKSFLVEYLAVCFVHGHDFLGMKVEPRSVLLIDQDTPEDVLDRRLLAFGNYMKKRNVRLKRKLYVESMKGYSLSDGSLIKRITEQDNVSVVIIDSLNSVSGRLDVNRTRDMSVLSRLKKTTIGEGKTLIIVHHISEHADITADEIMTIEDANKLTMGNSIINQQADTLFFLGNRSKSELESLFVRLVPKRISLNVKPFIARLVEKRNSMHFVMNGLYENRKRPLFEIDKDILRLFKKEPKRRKTYDVFYDMGSKYGIWAVRGSLKRLVQSKLLIEHKEHDRLFTYELRKRS